jgi:hypothetical protein
VKLPLGYRFASTYANIRKDNRDDLALIVSANEVLEDFVADRSLEHDHCQSSIDTRYKEHDRYEFRIPERMYLRLGHQEQRAKAGLMQDGQRNAKYHRAKR